MMRDEMNIGGCNAYSHALASVLCIIQCIIHLRVLPRPI